jgi:hypothetical protein
MKPPLFFIHHPLLIQSTKKISDKPIKFPSNPLSSEDDLPAHQSSNDWRSSDYSPPWSSEKEDPKEEDEDNADAEDDSNDCDSDFTSPPPKRARRA